MAELAFTFHWPPGELEAMEVADLLAWHAQAARINKLQQQGNPP